MLFSQIGKTLQNIPPPKKNNKKQLMFCANTHFGQPTKVGKFGASV